MTYRLSLVLVDRIVDRDRHFWCENPGKSVRPLAVRLLINQARIARQNFCLLSGGPGADRDAVEIELICQKAHDFTAGLDSAVYPKQRQARSAYLEHYLAALQLHIMRCTCTFTCR